MRYAILYCWTGFSVWQCPSSRWRCSTPRRGRRKAEERWSVQPTGPRRPIGRLFRWPTWRPWLSQTSTKQHTKHKQHSSGSTGREWTRPINDHADSFGRLARYSLPTLSADQTASLNLGLWRLLQIVDRISINLSPIGPSSPWTWLPSFFRLGRSLKNWLPLTLFTALCWLELASIDKISIDFTSLSSHCFGNFYLSRIVVIRKTDQAKTKSR